MYPSLCTIHQGMPLLVKTPRTDTLSAEFCCCEHWAHPQVHFFHFKMHMPWAIPHGILSWSWHVTHLCWNHQWNGTSNPFPPKQTSMQPDRHSQVRMDLNSCLFLRQNLWTSAKAQKNHVTLFVNAHELAILCRRSWNAGSGTRRLAAGWRFVGKCISLLITAEFQQQHCY